MAHDTDLDALHRAKWTQAAREAYHKEHPENFAGDALDYPIKDGNDVEDAWNLAGHADNPDKVRSRVKSIAKRLGLSGSLPDTAKEDGKSEERAADVPQPETPPAVLQVSARPTMYAPFLRVDAAKREVIGQATAEVPDSYGTIFAYYPEAFARWRGNIREQHDPKKAVGKRIDFFPDEQRRAVDLQAQVSRGAHDTWLKVEDNVLTGFSLSVLPDAEYGNDTSKWPKKEYGGKLYPYLPRYSIAEVSLVDNPACPGCDIQIVRADGFVSDAVEDEAAPDALSDAPPPAVPLARAGARMSAATKDKMHEGIAHTLHAAVSQMQNCGCDSCMAAQKMIDPDGDGDIDIGSFDDPDADADDLYNGRDSDMERSLTALIERLVSAQMVTVYSRLQGIAGLLSRSTPSQPFDLTTLEATLTRALDGRFAELAEVRASLETVKEQVTKIAEQPVPGGPVHRASAMPRPIEKALPTDAYAMPRYSSAGATYDAVRVLSQAGELNTVDKQVDAVAAALAAQHRG